MNELPEPTRVTSDGAFFKLRNREFLLTTHTMVRAKDRGMTLEDLLSVLDAPDDRVLEDPDYTYGKYHNYRYYGRDWCVIVDECGPAYAVVRTVLMRDRKSWERWAGDDPERLAELAEAGRRKQVYAAQRQQAAG